MKWKVFSGFITVLMFTGLTAAIEPSPEQSQGMDSENLEVGEGHKQTFLDQIIQSLSAVSGPEQVNPGEKINFELTADAEQDFNLDGTVNVVEVYRCQDISCDNGELVDVKRDFNSWDFVLEQGTGFSWNIDYTVPNEEAYYSATAYISDGQGTFYTDTPKYQFTVGTVEKPADINIESGPGISVDTDSNSVTGKITLTNDGEGDMEGTDIVEMQVRPEDEGPLSFLSFVSTQQTCDTDYPNNVHKEFSLNSRETESITLTADQLESGQSYDVFFLTREACLPNNEPVDPLPNSVKAGTFDLSSEQVEEPTDPTDSPRLPVIVLAVSGLVLLAGGYIVLG